MLLSIYPFSAIIFSMATGFLAKMKGYNWLLWLVLGLILAPIPFLIVSFLPVKEFRSTNIKNNKNVSGISEVSEACSACGKQIAIDASVCKYCGASFDIIDT